LLFVDLDDAVSLIENTLLPSIPRWGCLEGDNVPDFVEQVSLQDAENQLYQDDSDFGYIPDGVLQFLDMHADEQNNVRECFNDVASVHSHAHFHQVWGLQYIAQMNDLPSLSDHQRDNITALTDDAMNTLGLSVILCAFFWYSLSLAENDSGVG
jgi:hypothetical protein